MFQCCANQLNLVLWYKFLCSFFFFLTVHSSNTFQWLCSFGLDALVLPLAMERWICLITDMGASKKLKMATPLGPLLLQLFLLILLLISIHQSHPATASTIHLPFSIYHPYSLSVTDFGATGDGLHYDTAAIQSAIKACPTSHHTQCHVTFPPGTYLTRTLFLKSGVVLDIKENATLLGGTKMEDYPKELWEWYVVVAENASDVGITGGGVVDGHGLGFVKRFNERKNVMVSWNTTGACLGDECRPRLVGFIDCKNVRVWNITLTEPAYWWCVYTMLYSYYTLAFSPLFNDFVVVQS